MEAMVLIIFMFLAFQLTPENDKEGQAKPEYTHISSLISIINHKRWICILIQLPKM